MSLFCCWLVLFNQELYSFTASVHILLVLATLGGSTALQQQAASDFLTLCHELRQPKGRSFSLHQRGYHFDIITDDTFGRIVKDIVMPVICYLQGRSGINAFLNSQLTWTDPNTHQSQAFDCSDVTLTDPILEAVVKK